MSDRFLFLGDALALDLVDTEAVIRRRAVDLITPPGAYAAWWGEVARRYPELVARLAASDRQARSELLGDVMELRAALRVLFGAVADGGGLPTEALEVLNRVLGMIHDTVAVAQDGHPVPMIAHEGPEMDGPTVAIARSGVSWSSRSLRSAVYTTVVRRSPRSAA